MSVLRGDISINITGCNLHIQQPAVASLHSIYKVCIQLVLCINLGCSKRLGNLTFPLIACMFHLDLTHDLLLYFQCKIIILMQFYWPF